MPGEDHTKKAAGRRRFLRAAVALGAAGAAEIGRARRSAADSHRASPPGSDIAVNDTTALLFSAQAPLPPQGTQRDSQAVWARVIDPPDAAALLYLHGHNNFVTVDNQGVSRVPDWAEGNAQARDGAAARKAAGPSYGLDKLESAAAGRRPIVLVPEDSALSAGSFWATEPPGQYQDDRRLEILVNDCFAHLARLRAPSGRAYLPPGATVSGLKRFYLCGHSGGDIPLQEAAGSRLILPPPGGGLPTDLWLFDSTYWSNVTNYVHFCARWHAAGHLAGGSAAGSRFVCIYRPGTQTEAVADSLRGEIARALRATPDSLLKTHTPDNLAADIVPALTRSGAIFLRTFLEHDEIPTFFIPILLETSGSVSALSSSRPRL